MKKISILLILLSPLYIYSEDIIEKFSDIEKDFYYEIAGVWDVDAIKDLDGAPRSFSWGKGTFVKYISIIIDYNLWTKSDTWDFYGDTPYIIKRIEIIDAVNEEVPESIGKIYKLELLYERENISGIILIHFLKDGVIWFETLQQYKFHQGLVEVPDMTYGKNAYGNGDVFTGPDNLYYRRSGPLRL